MEEEPAASVLKQIKETFDKHDIEFWLDLGTLLGAVRDGKFIPWDNDIDLGTWYKSLPKIASAVKELRSKGFTVYGPVSYPRNYPIFNINVNILRKEGCPVSVILYRLDGDKATSPGSKPVHLAGKFLKYLSGVLSAPRYFELSHHHEVNRGTTSVQKSLIRRSLIRACISLPSALRKSLAEITWVIYKKLGCRHARVVVQADYFMNLPTMRFYGMEFKIPAKTEKYLAYMYGEDWKTPKKEGVHRFIPLLAE